MHPQTQANRLAALVQQKAHFPRYELALPLVTVKRSTLDSLKKKDIFILGVKALECILVKDAIICANVALIMQKDRYYFRIISIVSKKIKANENSKYKTVLCVLGSLKSRTLRTGDLIDVSQFELKSVTVIYENKTIAKGTLVNVEGKLAVQIDKVEKDE